MLGPRYFSGLALFQKELDFPDGHAQRLEVACGGIGDRHRLFQENHIDACQHVFLVSDRHGDRGNLALLAPFAFVGRVALAADFLQQLFNQHPVAREIGLFVVTGNQQTQHFAPFLFAAEGETGSLTRYPVIPIIINSVAPPFGPYRRVRKLGEAVGKFIAKLNKRVLILGTGGLSHEPPVPLLAGAPEEIANFLIAGRNPTPEFRAARQARTLATGMIFGKPECELTPLNPEWDQDFMNLLIHGQLEKIDNFEIEEISRLAGRSTHEIRTWVAAFAALAANGEVRFNYGQWGSVLTGAPALQNALANFDCRVIKVFDESTHNAFLCEILATRERSDGEALIYLNGLFRRIAQ